MAPNRRDSRSLIEVSARAEFARHGFAGARVARIAQKAGVNKQLIFYYFGSKAGLYDAIVDRLGSELAPQADPPEDHAKPAEKLRRLIANLLQTSGGQTDLARVALRDAAIEDPDKSPLSRTLRELGHQIAQAVSHGQGVGYFRDDVDPEIFSQQALTLAVGYSGLKGAFEKGPLHASQRARWERSATELLLRSLSW